MVVLRVGAIDGRAPSIVVGIDVWGNVAHSLAML